MNKNKTAFITGASSGIGAEYARQMASRGYDLILVGRRERLLKDLCNELETKYKVKAEYIIADLSDQNKLNLLENRIKQTENLEILINNAGFGSPGNFLETNVNEHSYMIMVHNMASVRFSHAALPILLKNKNGIIINVSSVAAWLISPVSGMYCATKLFLNSFTESLALSLKDTGVKVQALCPGFTTTDFHKKLGIDTKKLLLKNFMTAEYVVNYSLRDLDKNKVISIPGFKYKLIKLVNIIPRRLLYRLIAYFSKKNG